MFKHLISLRTLTLLINNQIWWGLLRTQDPLFKTRFQTPPSRKPCLMKSDALKDDWKINLHHLRAICIFRPYANESSAFLFLMPLHKSTWFPILTWATASDSPESPADSGDSTAADRWTRWQRRWCASGDRIRRISRHSASAGRSARPPPSV